MASKIKLFRYVRKFHRILGIYPSSKHYQYYSFNVKTTFGFCLTLFLTISIFWHFLFEASSMDEYGKGFVGSVSMLEGSIYFIVNFLKVKSILKLIKKLEDFIEMSKFEMRKKRLSHQILKQFYVFYQIDVHNSASMAVYKKLNRKIEKFSKRMYHAMIILFVFGCFIPAICVCCVNYYVLDMKDESFDLATPMTYV